MLGSELPGVGPARELDAETEQHGDAEAGGESQFGQITTALGERRVGRRHHQANAPVGDGVGFLERESLDARCCDRRR